MKITGKQLTVMVVAVCAAAVLTPTAVYAVTGSAVNITDPVTATSKARVISSRLAVGDGSGALTVDGTVHVNDGSGPLTVDGTVSTEPATSFTVTGEGTDDGSSPVLIRNTAANVGVSIGSIVLSHIAGAGAATVRLRAIHPNTTGNCSAGGTFQADYGDFAVPASDTRTLTFAPRLRVPKQASESCLYLFVTGSSATQVVDVVATAALY